MKDNINKILYIFCFFVISFVFLPNVVGATNHKLDLTAYVCDSSVYTDANDETNASNCLNNYVKGSIPTSYKRTDGQSVDAGSLILYIINYRAGTTKVVTGMNAGWGYDSTKMSPILTSSGELFQGSVSTINNLPSRNWTSDMHYVSADSAFTFLAADQSANPTALSKDTEMQYFAMRVKSTATGNVSINQAYADEAAMNDADGDLIDGSTTKSDNTVINEFDPTTDIHGLSLSVAGQAQSTDATLKTLTVTNGSTNYLTPTFTAGSKTLTYMVVVPNSVNTIDLEATTNDSGATIGDSSGTNLGTKTLNVGTQTYTVTCYSTAGNSLTYSVTVYRLSNDATLSGISLTNDVNIGTFNSSTNNYSATVPFATKTTSVSATTTNTNATVKSGTGDWLLSNSGSTTNSKGIVVEAENCLSKYSAIKNNTCTSNTYTLNISRIAASTNAYLSSISIDGTSLSTFNKDTMTYDLGDVANNKTSINLNALVEDTGKATISSTDLGTKNLNVGDNTFIIHTTAEDSITTKEYTVKIHRKSNNALLSSLSLSSDPTGHGSLNTNLVPTTNEGYKFTFDELATKINVTATVSDTNKASVVILDASSSNKGTNTLNTATTSFDTSVSLINVIVTAEDGTINTYVITTERQKSTDSTLSNISINNSNDSTEVYSLNSVFSSATKKYTTTVEAPVSSVNIIATPNSKHATITAINGKYQNLDFGNNEIEIVVTAEDKSTSSYFVTINRTKYSIKTLSKLNVVADGITYDITPELTDNVSTYSLNEAIPFASKTITINAIATDAEHGATVSNVGSHDILTGQSSIDLIVTAQDNTTRTYTLNLNRKYNSDNTINNLAIAGYSPTLVNAGIDETTYTLTVPNSISEIKPSDVSFTKSSDAKSNITETLSLSTQDSSKNVYSFTVTSESGSIHKYSTTITRTKSSDNNLTSISLAVSKSDVRTCVMEGSNTCTISVPVNTSTFTMSASIPSTATISPINGTTYEMASTDSEKDYNLAVTAEDGTIKDYVVHVSREKSSDATLKSLLIDGVEYKNNIDSTNKVSVVYNTDINTLHPTVSISADVSDTGKATIIDTNGILTTNNLAYGINKFEFKVKAENGLELTYTIEITRKMKIDASLKSLTIDGTEHILDLNNNTLDLNVSYGTTKVNVQGIVTDNASTISEENATITQGIGDNSLTTGSNAIHLIVAAQDRTITQEYTINIKRAKNTNNSIDKVSVAGVEAIKDAASGIYSVTVPNEVNTINAGNLNVTFPDGYKAANYDVDPTIMAANMSLDTQTIPNIYTFQVMSESGTYATYQINITRTKSNYKKLKLISVSNGSFNPSFDPDTNTYTVTVPYNAISSTISYTTIDNFKGIVTGDIGTVSITSSSQKFEIQVTPEDNSAANIYTLNFVRSKSTANVLSNLKVLDIGQSITDQGYSLTPKFNSSTLSYNTTVPGNISQVNIVATVPTDDRSTIDSSTVGIKDLNVGENTFSVKVTSEAGYSQYYKLVITREKKFEAMLSDIKVDNTSLSDFAENKYTYDLGTVENDKSSLNIIATNKDSDASYTISNADSNGKVGLSVGDNNIIITSTAQDGKTKLTYTIKVNRKANSDTNLSALSVLNYSLSPDFDKEITDYTIIADSEDFEIKQSDITATPEYSLSNVTKDPDLSLVSGDNNKYSVKVTAEDGTTKTYNITIKKPTSKNADLAKVDLTNGTLSSAFDKDNQEYTISVPNGVTTFAINGTPSQTLATVDGNGTYNIADYNNKTITLKVTAEDTTIVKNYVFHIVQALNSNAFLDSLSVSGYTLNQLSDKTKGFDKAITSYTIGNVLYGTTKINVKALTNNANATISIDTSSSLHDFDKEITIDGATIGTHQINVVVTPEDNIQEHKKTYVIYYNVIYSNNNYLASIVPNTSTLVPIFNKATKAYSLSVNNATQTISFNVKTDQNNATVSKDKINYSLASEGFDLSYDLNVGSNSCNIYVKAEDGTIATYTITVIRSAPVASDNNLLTSLSIADYSLYQEDSNGNIDKSKGFATTENTYSIGKVIYKTNKLTVNAKPQDGNAKLYYLVDGIQQDSNVVDIPIDSKTHAVSVIVEAANGDKNTYTIHYNKIAGSDTSLEYIKDNLNKINYVSGTKTYSMDVDESITSVVLTVNPTDSTTGIMIDGKNFVSPYPCTYTKNNLAIGSNSVIITVTAENGNTDTYTIKINRVSAQEFITSKQWGHTIENGFIKTIALGKTSLDVKNELDNDNAKLFIYDNNGNEIKDTDLVGTGYVVKLIKDATLNDSKIIVVKGDVNGDGKIMINDATMIINNLLNRTTLTGASKLAADIDDSSSIFINDANKIINHLLTRQAISYPKK
jgi:hypothetical protein